ncbi:MAG: hypothetical protein R3C68_18345 [Myxococcota bacterium]
MVFALILSGLVPSINFDIPGYRAQGHFIDSEEKFWDFDETWKPNAFYKIELRRNQQLAGVVVVDLAECLCHAFDVERGVISLCVARNVVANSPVRRLLPVLRQVKDRWSDKTQSARDEPIENIVQRVGKNSYQVSQRTLSAEGKTSSEFMGALVTLEKINDTKPPRQGRTTWKHETSIVMMWLEPFHAMSRGFTCHYGYGPGIEVRLLPDRRLQVVDVAECSMASSANILMGDIFFQADQSRLTGITDWGRFACGAKGTTFAADIQRRTSKFSVQLKRDMKANAPKTTAATVQSATLDNAMRDCGSSELLQEEQRRARH